MNDAFRVGAERDGRLVVSLPPSSNNLYRNVPGKGRVLNKTGRQYKQEVKTLAMLARLPFLHGDVRLCMVVYFPDRRRRDLSNTLKVVEDALKGIAYGDDSQVARIELTRRYDRGNPRAEVHIEPWQPVTATEAA